MFDFQYSIGAGPNMGQGARAAMFAHLTPAGQTPQSPRGPDRGPMILEYFRAHVGGSHPGVASWRSDTHRVIGIAGAREPADQIAVLNGYGTPTRIGGLDGTYNAYAVTWLTSLIAALGQTIADRPLHTWVFGYSWGGAAGPLFCSWLKEHFRDKEALCVSYGTPRFTDGAGARQLGQFLHTRLMANNDPLPYLCPQPEEAPLLSIGFPLDALAFWSRYQHLGNGVILRQNGVMTAGTLPPDVPLPIDLRAGDWFALNIGEGRPHNIVNYANTLNGAFPEEVSPPEPEMYRGHGLFIEHAPKEETRAGANVTQLRRIIHSRVVERQAQQVQNLGAGQGASASSRVKIVKDSKTWYVTLDGRRVYVATSKRDARGAANGLRAVVQQVEQQPDMWIDADILGRFRSS